MQLTFEKQTINGTFLNAFSITSILKLNNGYLKIIYVSNIQVVLEIMLKVRKIKVGGYIGQQTYLSFFVFRNSSCIFT